MCIMKARWMCALQRLCHALTHKEEDNPSSCFYHYHVQLSSDLSKYRLTDSIFIVKLFLIRLLTLTDRCFCQSRDTLGFLTASLPILTQTETYDESEIF